MTKKQIDYRTRMERFSEIKTIVDKFKEIGLSKEMKGVEDFYKIARDFVDTGDSYNGVIKIKEADRDIHYILNNNKKHELSVFLRNASSS